VLQWYCNGSCSPIGPEVGFKHCDEADADLFCKVLTGNPDATATSWEKSVATADAGFCCLGLDDMQVVLGPLPELDIEQLCYQGTDLLANHGDATVLHKSDVTCKVP
jgi:hypothetical protein